MGRSRIGEITPSLSDSGLWSKMDDKYGGKQTILLQNVIKGHTFLKASSRILIKAQRTVVCHIRVIINFTLNKGGLSVPIELLIRIWPLCLI